MAFRWRVNDGPILNSSLVAFWFFRGSRPVLLRNPKFWWFFMGWGGGVWTPCPLPLDLPMNISFEKTNCIVGGTMLVANLSSADNLCKLFGPISRPTKSRSWYGSKWFDTLIVFQEEFFKKLILKRSQQTKTIAWNITHHSNSKNIKLYLVETSFNTFANRADPDQAAL